jgi:hypothetical protein
LFDILIYHNESMVKQMGVLGFLIHFQCYELTAAAANGRALPCRFSTLWVGN